MSVKAFRCGRGVWVMGKGGWKSTGAATTAAALIALQKAIEKAGSLDRAKVRQALTELNIMTFYGPIKFGANGMNGGRDLPIIQVQKGKSVVLYPDVIKQATMVPAGIQRPTIMAASAKRYGSSRRCAEGSTMAPASASRAKSADTSI